MQAAAVSPPPSRIEAEVRRIRELLARGQFASALAAAQPLLTEAPAIRDIQYKTAVSQRYLGLIPDALATLAEMERHHPNYARLYQERGHCYVTMRAAERAIEAFSRAVALNSSLPASWNALQVLYRMTGRPADADHAAAQAANLAALPAEIVSAFSMYAD